MEAGPQQAAAAEGWGCELVPTPGWSDCDTSVLAVCGWLSGFCLGALNLVILACLSFSLLKVPWLFALSNSPFVMSDSLSSSSPFTTALDKVCPNVVWFFFFLKEVLFLKYFIENYIGRAGRVVFCFVFFSFLSSLGFFRTVLLKTFLLVLWWLSAHVLGCKPGGVADGHTLCASLALLLVLRCLRAVRLCPSQ